MGVTVSCRGEKEQNDVFLPQFGIRIVHKKVGSLTNILYLYR